jgi:signal transduction histidine kinase
MGLSGFLLLSLLEGYFVRAMQDSLAAQARITAQALIPGAIAEGPPAELAAAAYSAVQQQRVSNLSLQAQNFAPPPTEIPRGDLDLSYLADASLQLSSELDTRIRIFDTQGVVLLDSRDQRQQGADLSGDPLVVRALGGQYANQADRSADPPVMRAVLPVLVEGQIVAGVYLDEPLRDVIAVMWDLRLRWLLATGIALLLSGMVGLVLSGAIARPLRRLTTAAASVADGRFDLEVPVESRDELGQLSTVFNKMTARLRAAHQIQVDFVANVSHELRTPLTAIKGLVETLRDGAVDDPGVRDRFLETVEGETDRLIRLVNDLLILSRADSEALDLRCEAVDVGQLSREMAARLGPQAATRQVRIQVEANAEPLLAVADPDRIEQVLVNLLDNAIKYSHTGGTVILAVSASSEHSVELQVWDEGIGIPAADLSRIGERFYRSDKARSRALGGSGLGLAIAVALVEAHGGTLRLESAEGAGTVVKFTLPAI